ncbi:glycoside hydrolase family 76 protein [Microbacterium rhizomatis]|nr:glycoside hydrolase family 76 protein [Microbacterium rhizomatis]
MPDLEPWNDRAAAAEYAVLSRYVRRVGPLAAARAHWPARTGVAGVSDEVRVWHYWWHAHLIHCAADAARHRPSPGRRARIESLARGVAVRTAGRWVNRFYDDIAWMGVALQSAAPRSRAGAVARIADRLVRGIDPRVGALPWHVGSDLYNAPANGPAAILLARIGAAAPARRLAGWMAATLDDPVTGLVRDGLEGGPGGSVRPAIYSYNQGVAIGAALALADAPDALDRTAQRGRAAALIAAVRSWCDEDLIPPTGGGDGGLFAGILCRYLSEAAVAMRDDGERGDAAASARRLVLANARALWDGRSEVDGRPFFSADPRRPAVVPAGPSRPRRADGGATAGHDHPDGDLSVQLSAWMTLEAAVTVTAAAGKVTS